MERVRSTSYLFFPLFLGSAPARRCLLHILGPPPLPPQTERTHVPISQCSVDGGRVILLFPTFIGDPGLEVENSLSTWSPAGLSLVFRRPEPQERSSPVFSGRGSSEPGELTCFVSGVDGCLRLAGTPTLVPLGAFFCFTSRAGHGPGLVFRAPIIQRDRIFLLPLPLLILSVVFVISGN